MSDIETGDEAATNTGSTLNDQADEESTMSKPAVTPFSTKTWREDLTLIVEDKPLYVSKHFLAYASPVFDAMFTGEFKEKDQEEIPLPDKKYDDVVEFLQCIYPDPMRKSVTTDSVFKILPLAHEYQVKHLERACETCLVQCLSQHEYSNQVYDILETACAYSLDKVIDTCVEIVAERLDDDEFERKVTLPDGIINAIKVKRLHVLKTKYKDVFGHVKTSRALYQLLGAEAKQKHLVKQYINGEVVGDIVNLTVNCATLKASTEVHVGGKQFSINIDVENVYSRNISIISLQSSSQQNNIDCLCAFHVRNWMNGKNDIRSEIFKFQLRQFASHHIRLDNIISASKLRDQKAGFCKKGNIEMTIFLFWIK